ncbi:MAG: hypothetical protein C0410_07055 [Anaerolinea sp.]|nr:hypothetical protein [Anaerolinea sp.]
MMNSEIKKMFFLLKREFFEFRSVRVLAAFGVMGILQGIIMVNSQEHGLMEDTFLIFLIGGLCTVITCFDLVSREREQHTIDLLLTQGINRGSMYLVKWITAALLSAIGALVFCFATIIGTAISGEDVLWNNFLPEFGMITWAMGSYAAIALLCSIIFRRPKSSLIAALMVWVIFRPAVFGMLVIDPIRKALNLSKTELWRVVAFIPDFAFRLGLDIEKAAPKDVIIPASWPLLALSGYILLGTLLAWLIFIRQDEPIQ